MNNEEWAHESNRLSVAFSSNRDIKRYKIGYLIVMNYEYMI